MLEQKQTEQILSFVSAGNRNSPGRVDNSFSSLFAVPIDPPILLDDALRFRFVGMDPRAVQS